MGQRISLERDAGGAWAVKHGDGYLGFTRTQAEAERIGLGLVDWLRAQGRSAELHIEPPSAPRDRQG